MKGYLQRPGPRDSGPVDPFRLREQRLESGYYKARHAARKVDFGDEPALDWSTEIYAGDDDPRAWDSWTTYYDAEAGRGLRPLEPDRWRTPAL
jgi:hypothetical protein